MKFRIFMESGHDSKNSRLIVEVDGEVVFSRFDMEGKCGGVNSLDQEVMSRCKSAIRACAFTGPRAT
jgi:hypothetical protein